MHSTPPEPVYQPPPEYLVTGKIKDSYAYLNVCPRSQTMVSHSITHSATILFALPCGTWSCPICSRVKIKKLSAGVQRAEPNRLLTLTVDPALYASRKEAWEKTRKQVPILIRLLRKQYGEVEYLRVTEVTSKGWPHYHLLVRSGYLPFPVVKKLWNQLTGAKIVDIRQVKKSWSAYKYLVKYLSKLHNIDWTERHVSTSKNFIPPEPENDYEPIVHAEGEFFNQHPASYIAEHFGRKCLKRVSVNAHLVLPADSYRGFQDQEVKHAYLYQDELAEYNKPPAKPLPPSVPFCPSPPQSPEERAALNTSW